MSEAGDRSGAERRREDMEEAVQANLRRIGRKIVVMSGKGGVGKSTVAVNLAIALAREGRSVGLLDADLHGPNVPKMLGIDGRRLEGDADGGILPCTVDGLKVVSMAFLLSDEDTPVIWRGPLKMGALRQFLGEVHWGDLDYLVIDLPPGTGDEPLSIAQMVRGSSGAIIVTTPQDVALLDARKAVRFAEALKMPVLGVVENMSGFVCPHCGERTDLFKSGGGERAAGKLGVPFLGRVPFDPVIVEAGDNGTTVVLHGEDPDRVAPFRGITDAVERQMNRLTSSRG